MSIKLMFAKTFGRTAGWSLKTFTSGGSSYPGKLAEKIDPNILKDLARDYRVVIITGTNGKTMTTSFTHRILSTKFGHVLTNSTGSNLKQGIVSTFVMDKAPKNTEKIAVLEVDEASLRHITEHITPDLVMITNLFQDQTDRYANVNATLDLIVEGLNKVPQTTVMVNADNPILVSGKINNPRLFFGMANEDKTELKPAPEGTEDVACPNCGEPLHYHYIAYSNIGDYKCVNCDFERPTLNFQIDKINELNQTSSTFTIDGTRVTLNVAGLYNTYNALAAFAVGEHFKVAPNAMVSALESVQPVFGRQEVIEFDNKEMTINLIKNPVGLNQVIDLVTLEKEPFTLIALLNSKPADGKDPHWIDAGNFEELAHMENITEVLVSGMDKEVMESRLLEAGFDKANMQTLETTEEIAEVAKATSNNKIYVLATYTAMLDLRKLLADQNLVKERMA